MIAGFDYGTSNCAVGSVRADGITRIKLEPDSHYLPSLVYAEIREAIVEHVAAHMVEPKQHYLADRHAALRAVRNYRQDNGIIDDEKLVYFGSEAMAHYVLAPEEGFFAKSPKSFLGASGLSQGHLSFFEDIVAAMMLQVNRKAEQQIGEPIEHVVIGRPVNFASLNTQAGNSQAIDILTKAAKRSGYQHIEFLYEPLAAGLAYEQSLSKNALVLVLDIGGGTSDCTLMHMGPDHKNTLDRSSDILAHTGIRTGGNDLDIELAARKIMPLMGMNTLTKDGLPIPAKYYLNAVRINDVNAQTAFYSADSLREIRALSREAVQPELVQRFINMLNQKRNYALIKQCELAKIKLSSALDCVIDLTVLGPDFSAPLTRELLAEAIMQPMVLIMDLIKQTVAEAGTKPEQIFVTGGSGQSPILRAAVQAIYPDIAIVDGDHFGSVVTGLTQWAEKIYR